MKFFKILSLSIFALFVIVIFHAALSKNTGFLLQDNGEYFFYMDQNAKDFVYAK